MMTLYGHVHHDLICEPCYDVEGRRRYIEANKPAEEIATRLRLMQPVKGKVASDITKAGEAYCQTRAAYSQVIHGNLPSVGSMFIPFLKATDAYERVLYDNLSALLELHAAECGCAWTPSTGVDFT